MKSDKWEVFGAGHWSLVNRWAVWCLFRAVVLAVDPSRDARAFVNVRYTFRRGRMIHGNL